MTSLPESPDLSETRQEIDTLMCDGCGISAPVATGVGGGRHHCGGTFRPFVRDESLAAATARLSLFCAWGEKIDGTPRRKYTDGGGVYFIRRDIDAVLSALTAARAEREESRARAVQGEERETHYLALSSAALLMFAAEGRYGMCTPEWWEAHNNVMQTMRRVFFPSARTSTPAPSKGNSTQRKCPDCGRTDFAKRLSVSHVLCECGTQYWRDHLPQERKRVSLPVEGTVDA